VALLWAVALGGGGYQMGGDDPYVSLFCAVMMGVAGWLLGSQMDHDNKPRR